MKNKIGILLTHPVQYLSAFFKALANEFDLTVYYCIKPDKKEQGRDFGIEFSWDVPLLEGYKYEFLKNISLSPDTNSYLGCDTPEIAEKINNAKFDIFIIFGWYYKSAHQALAACNRYNVAVYARGDSTIRSSHPAARLLKKLYFKRFLDKFDGFLAPGEKFKEYLKFYGVSDNKIVFCPHFVDNDFFEENKIKSVQNRAALREKIGITPEDLVFLFCGKLVSRKRPLDLLKALDLFKQKNIPVKAIIAGDGVLRRKLEQYAEARGLSVYFSGFKNQSQLPEMYSISDCLVLPSSWSETWGLVVNESFACGVPAIISDRCGCAIDMIEEGATGYIYKCTDVKNLFLSMNEFIRAKSNGFDFAPAIKQKLGKYRIKDAVDSIRNIIR